MEWDYGEERADTTQMVRVRDSPQPGSNLCERGSLRRGLGCLVLARDQAMAINETVVTHALYNSCESDSTLSVEGRTSYIRGAIVAADEHGEAVAARTRRRPHYALSQW